MFHQSGINNIQINNFSCKNKNTYSNRIIKRAMKSLFALVPNMKILVLVTIFVEVLKKKISLKVFLCMSFELLNLVRPITCEYFHQDV